MSDIAVKQAAQILERMESEGLTLSEALKLKPEFIEGIYSLAHAYYTQGKYQEAEALFYTLVSLAPTEYRYVFGLAATYYQKKDYGTALFGFYTLSQIAVENPTGAYYMGDCCEKMGIKEEAIDAYKFAVAVSGDKKEYKNIKEKASLLMEALKTRK